MSNDVLQHAAAPARGHFAISPSDTVDQPFRALFVSTAGNVAIVDHDGVVLTYPSIAANTLLNIQGKRVNSTNTTAADIKGWR